MPGAAAVVTGQDGNGGAHNDAAAGVRAVDSPQATDSSENAVAPGDAVTSRQEGSDAVDSNTMTTTRTADSAQEHVGPQRLVPPGSAAVVGGDSGA